MFSVFEKLVQPYPEAPPTIPPRGFFAFLWDGTRGMRPYLALMTLSTAAIGAFEALLFGFLGSIVDRLASVAPARLWVDEGRTLLALAGVLVGSIALVALQSLIKHQALAGNHPMRLRWNFHRLMLSQSMSFFQDEFAGRIVTKLMQTALAVRDTWMILGDILVFVVIYFVTMVTLAGGFDTWLLLPFLVWLAFYVMVLVYFVPRLGRMAREQADARSLMTGRVTDAYTNIATVKLFSHAGREAGYARSAMQELLHTAYAPDAPGHRIRGGEPHAQRRSDPRYGRHRPVAVDAGAGGRGRGRRSHGHGAAAERHLALDDVGDGRRCSNTSARCRTASTPSRARTRWSTGRSTAAARRAWRHPVRRRGFRLWRAWRRAARDRRTLAAHPAGREDRPGGPLGRRQVDDRQPAAALPRPGERPHPDRRPGHRPGHAGLAARADRHGDAGHLAAAPLRARQHPLRPSRRRPKRR